MSPFSFGRDPAITKKCPHCDTALEFESCGRRVMFAAHDDEFCRDMTRERVRLLESALLHQREAYEHHVAKIKERVNALLAEHGLPSLEERAKEVQARAVVRAAQIGLNVTGPLRRPAGED